MTEIKPLNWQPVPGIGYSVVRRPDGGMDYTFTDMSEKTVQHWQEFSHQHLLDSDRLTRNLYDLRQVQRVSQQAISTAIEVNSDPAATEDSPGSSGCQRRSCRCHSKDRRFGSYSGFSSNQDLYRKRSCGRLAQQTP